MTIIGYFLAVIWGGCLGFVVNGWFHSARIYDLECELAERQAALDIALHSLGSAKLSADECQIIAFRDQEDKP